MNNNCQSHFSTTGRASPVYKGGRNKHCLLNAVCNRVGNSCFDNRRYSLHQGRTDTIWLQYVKLVLLRLFSSNSFIIPSVVYSRPGSALRPLNGSFIRISERRGQGKGRKMTTGLKTMEFLKLSRRVRRRLNARSVSDQLLADGEEKRKRISLNVDTKMLKIGFIGGGKMAQALAKGFIRAGVSKGDMILASCLPNDASSIDAFKEMGSNTVFTNGPVVDYGDILILSVKPQVIPKILPDLKNYNKLLLSIAMGVPLAYLEKAVPQGTPVIRVMPNTPALVGCGATVFARGTSAGDKEAEIAEKLFCSVGFCEEISESMIDPVTALAGSGPAYVYMMIEALADGGVKMGLMRSIAYKLAAQTVLGAGAMVMQTNSHPGQLKDDVTSPAGSTITGVHYLEQHGLRSALIGAVEVATKRCLEVSSLPDES